MIGILIQLVISWGLLWLIEKKDLLALGVKPNYNRIRDLIFGFLIAGSCCVTYHVSITTLAGTSWTVNPNFSFEDFVNSLWLTMKSVLFEELIFRGALLYILIQRTNVRMACLISAIAFGVYHWFSYGIIGDSRQMVIVFFMTGIWGLMFAYGFAKTKSLYLPIGLHLGWNFLNNIIFSQNSPGEHWLTTTESVEPIGLALSLVVFLFQVFATPCLVYWYLQRHAERLSY